MKNKIIIFLIISAIFLFSMQICTFFTKGDRPIVTIIFPTENYKTVVSNLKVYGTIQDNDNDAVKVKVGIEGTNISTEDTTINDSTFEISLDVSAIGVGTKTIYAIGYDSKNNESEKFLVNIELINPNNLINNGNFSIHNDNFNDGYSNITLINNFLNKQEGDYLENWSFYIFEQYALDNKINIDLTGTYLRYYSIFTDSENNEKMMVLQNINHKVSAKTKLYISFVISGFNGANNPDNAPIKISINGSAGNTGFYIASFSTKEGEDNGKNKLSNLNEGDFYEAEFYLKADAGIELDTQINTILIWVDGMYWDVTIYKIILYEEP